MKYFAFPFLVLVTLTSISFNCSENTVDSTDLLPPGRRDYVWTVDTIKAFDPVSITRIWGSSPNDIWGVATGANTRTFLWHFDGNQWAIDSISFGWDLFALYGFASDDVWIGTLGSTIYHFDGISWNLSATLTTPGYDKIGFEDIWGNSPNDIFAVGAAQNSSTSDYIGIIAHYNGSVWQLIDIPELRVSFSRIRYDTSSNLYILTATNFDNGFLDKVMTFNGKDIQEPYSYSGSPSIDQMNGTVYISIEGKIFENNFGQLSLWRDFSNTPYHGRVLGKHENDFFGFGYRTLVHYNGTDVKSLLDLNANFNMAQIFEKDIFILATDYSTFNSLIIRGHLNDE